MNYYIDFQGTCWLIQYLNFIHADYDAYAFYKLLGLNRFIRYKKCIELVKNKSLLEERPYLFLQLLNFDGSFFDIEDIINYDIKGELNKDISYEKIIFNNEKTTMLLLDMYENNIDYEDIIMNNFFKTFGNLTFNKSNITKRYSFVTFSSKLSDSNYELINSNLMYDNIIYVYNSLNSPLELIDKELTLSNKVLISLDLGKSVYIDNTLLFPENISKDTLNMFLSIDNHYYIIVDIIFKEGKKYYKAFSGYNDTNEFCLIDEKYLKMYINHLICDKIIVENIKKINFFDFEESV